MGITERQRQRRQETIRKGLVVWASDIPALMGASPWKSKHDLWLEYVYGLEPLDEWGKFPRPVDIGNAAESWVIDLAKEYLGVQNGRPVQVKRNQERVSKNKIQAAHLDAVVQGHPWLLEIKFTGNLKHFGDAGTDQVPDWVLAQVLAQLGCSGLEEGKVFVSTNTFGGVSLVPFVVPRNQEAIDLISEHVHEFLFKHVKERLEPHDFKPSLSIAKRVVRDPAHEPAILDETLFKRWSAASSASKAMQTIAEEQQALILSRLGHAEVGLVNGQEALTYYRQSKPTTRYSKDPAYHDHCPECGVGHKNSTPRRLHKKKVT